MFLINSNDANNHNETFLLDDMSKNRYSKRRRPVAILDAGYVSITPDDIYSSSQIIGLHGIKLICVISTVFILLLASLINFTVS